MTNTDTFPILHTGEFHPETGEELMLCGYSLEGFKSDAEQQMWKSDYIHVHCKHWHYFGDGLCYSCSCTDECPFKNITIEDYEKWKETQLKTL